MILSYSIKKLTVSERKYAQRLIFDCLFGLLFPPFSYCTWGFVIPELQNQVTRYDVTNRVANSKILFLKFFELLTRCEKNFHIVLELVTRDFQRK